MWAAIRAAIRAAAPDALQRGQGVVAALAAAGDTPQLVIAEGVAAMEVADAVAAVIGGRRGCLQWLALSQDWS